MCPFVFGYGFLFYQTSNIFLFCFLFLTILFVLFAPFLVFHSFNLMLNIEFIFAWTLRRLNLMHSFHGLFLSIYCTWTQWEKKAAAKSIYEWWIGRKVKRILQFILFCYFCFLRHIFNLPSLYRTLKNGFPTTTNNHHLNAKRCYQGD